MMQLTQLIVVSVIGVGIIGFALYLNVILPYKQNKTPRNLDDKKKS